ncbi:hypothetical protein ACR820_05775 [Streptomyces netropsis]
MNDFAIRTTDQVRVTFNPPPSVAIPLGTLKGSATRRTVQKRPVCLQGDELPGELKRPFEYARIDTPSYLGGAGALEFILDFSNLTEKTNAKGKKALLKGGHSKRSLKW